MPFQMALDEVLFDKQKLVKQDPILRFYFSSGAWISVGYSYRDPSKILSSDLVRKNPGVPSVKRLTGGGCVLHGQDLIFSFIGRAECDPERLRSVRTSYGLIHEGVKMAFKKFGFDLKFYDPLQELPQGNDCFDFPVVSDLSWQGKKIAGGAQKRSQGVLLHHESIQVPQGIGRDVLIENIRQGFETIFGVSIENQVLEPESFFQAMRKVEGQS